ncbi:hypothetical protein E1B28_001563 [Marasmius oreades]|uniref:Wbp11/ELF5/Saf1 N-terminal domain-containing protein n=1 Tax=Marasmius oreades TaxID=181124 RepID=A0A9P8AFS4_9AGAR|nr:uncharacterized protein E1B28_001563 [Marasmius oreades]KAG7099750.1 hypothetical protein E1B28_001563 [Marasmius oreades]
MGKGKTLNPADAFRKAQRKKELKKNKTERSKARDFALVKKDTSDLQDEIERLEALEKPSADEASRLKSLKAELENINNKKEEYVKEHPDQRRLVFRQRRGKNEGGKSEEEIVLPQKRNLFKKNGLPRHPERSIYYDPVMNPYGVAPPGMPYAERPLLPGEVDSEAEESEGEDDDIAMPEGPPPGVPGFEETVNDDDDIPMPKGLPPGEEPVEDNEDIPFPPSSDADSSPLPPSLPPAGVSLIPPGFPTGMPPLPPPPPQGFPAGVPPPPPIGFSAGVPPLPPGFPAGFPPPPPPTGGLSTFPPFPPGFVTPPFPPTGFRPSMPPPPGFYPRQKSASAMQDPLSSIPHQTYQAHRASKLSLHPSLPARPSLSGALGPNGPSSSATISAEPELRDFKKEATAFVPTSLKRKRAAAPPRVNAAPGVTSADGDEEEEISAEAEPPRPDLLSTIQNQFGIPSKETLGKNIKVEEAKLKKKDDYDKFMDEIGDILNPS